MSSAGSSTRGGFASILAGCRFLFPAALVDAAGWKRILARAETLPRAVIDNYFGFEFHLGEARADADLFVVAPPGSALARHYVRAGAGRAGSAASALGAALAEQAGDRQSWLARSVAVVMLEYDLAGPAPPSPDVPPGIFFSPRLSVPGSRDGVREHRDPEALLAALAAVAGWSNGREALLPEVERIFSALPEAACVFQAGVLPARSPRAVRLVVAGVAKEEAPALLERLRWPGPTAAAADALAVLDDPAVSVAVSVDVTVQGLGPRLGLELYRPPYWLAADRAGWRPLIAGLEERGWCLPAKAGGLRRWPGVDRLLGGGEAHRVRQGINHVKVVVERGARTVAKAYVGMRVRPCETELRPPRCAGGAPGAASGARADAVAVLSS